MDCKQIKFRPVLTFFTLTVAALGMCAPVMAQSLDDLNIQIHGYATQGFLYTSENNIFTTHSSDGSPAWSEAVVNVTSQPIPKLRVAVQARYFVLGNFGNSITLDWAAADYKADDRFGVRFGKVKTPAGLFNEVQDIDPSYMWALLPQSVYPITSRNSLLAHLGGVVYGAFKLGRQAGKLEYRGWGGQRTIAHDDGYTLAQRESGIDPVNGVTFVTEGATLRWRLPEKGILVGASYSIANHSVSPIAAANGAVHGTQTIQQLHEPFYFASFERGKWMAAGEYNRLPVNGVIALPGIGTIPLVLDLRGWYGMGSYKATDKLTLGLYHSQAFNKDAALGPPRYSKDWAISGRYDFNQYIYAKAEEHVIDGTQVGYDLQLNPTGLKPDTRLTVLKIGVSF